MEYVAVKFNITGADESLIQTANDLLVDAVSAVGFESFEYRIYQKRHIQ